MDTFATPDAIYQGHKSIEDRVHAALGDYSLDYNVGDIADAYLGELNAEIPDGVGVYNLGATITAATVAEWDRLMEETQEHAYSVDLRSIIHRHGMIEM